MRLGIKLDGAKRSVVTLIVNVRRGRLELLRQYVVNISIVKLVKMMQTKCLIKFIRNSASCDGFIQKIHPGWARIHYSTK